MDARVMSNGSYVVPFNLLLKQIGIHVPSSDSERIELTRDQFQALIRKLLACIPVDEAWYRNAYKDIDEAIAAGHIASAKEHFVADGYFEGRLPGKITVDEAFYISQYPDVAEGIGDGEINSAQEHFETHGFSEGRLPFKV
jgi:hypothetical protein